MTRLKLIPLRGKRGRGSFAVVDAQDYDDLMQFRWMMTHHGYAVRMWTGLDDQRHQELMHRRIMKPTTVAFVDHLDGDRLRNTRANLRVCDAAGNQANRKLIRTNTSGYTGVSYSKDKAMWRATMNIGGKRKNLGWFDTAEEAAVKYRLTARTERGEFADYVQQIVLTRVVAIVFLSVS